MRLAVLVGLAGQIGLGGCFFTQPINERPRAEISKLSPGPIHYPGEIVEFNAGKVRDGHGGALRCVWETYLCPAGEACARVGDPTILAPLEIYQVALDGAAPAERHARRQIQLTVLDDEDAADRAVYELEVGNREPMIELQVQQGGSTATTAVVGVPLEVVAASLEPDGDPIALSWSLTRPRDSDPAVAVWQALADGRQRLVPDVAGVWRVDVTAADGFGGEENFAESIVVTPDGPPCIAETEPRAGAGRFVMVTSDGPRRFAALRVVDDLDGFPASAVPGPAAGASRFRWSMAAPITGGSRVELTGERGAGLVVDPARHPPGTTLELRVEVADRVARASGCADAAATCESAPGCAQRLTWEVTVR